MAENLVALLNETVEDDAAAARQSNEQKISTLVSIIKSAQEYKTIDNALKFNKAFGSIETLNKTTVTISGKAYSLSKANATSEAPYILEAPALSSIKESDVKDYVSRYNQFAKDLGIQNFNCAEDVAGVMYINFITSTPYYADVIGAAAINKFSADGGNKLELDGKELLPSNYMTVLGNIYTPDMFTKDCKDKGYTVPENEVQSTYEFVLGKIYVAVVTGVGEGKSYSDVAFGTYSNNVTDASGLQTRLTHLLLQTRIILKQFILQFLKPIKKHQAFLKQFIHISISLIGIKQIYLKKSNMNMITSKCLMQYQLLLQTVKSTDTLMNTL